MSNLVNARRIPITINVTNSFIADPAAPSEKLVRTESLPSLFYGESVIFCISFVDSSGAPYEFNTMDVFELAIDKDFLHGNDPLMAYSGTDAVDIQGDWTDINRKSGKISVRVNCATSGFLQKLGSAESLQAYLEIRKAVPDGSYSILGLGKITARNVVKAEEGAPSATSVEYYTAAQTDAMFAAGYNVEFSVDGTSMWHTSQTDADRFFRFRNASTPNADYSNAIALLEGPRGETGITGATGETGPAGADATVSQASITTSGIVRLASAAEAVAGEDENSAVTPAALAAVTGAINTALEGLLG